MHESGNCPACEAIRAAMEKNDLVYTLGIDISLSRDHDGPLTVTIPVGTQYEGQTLTILHCAGGVLETLTAVVQDGKATFTLSSLSPIAIFENAALDDIPLTGDTGATLIWWLLGGVSAIGMAVLIPLGRKKCCLDSRIEGQRERFRSRF